MGDDVANLAGAIHALSPPAKLRLAADLLEQRRAALAHKIASSAVEELGASLALRVLEELARRG